MGRYLKVPPTAIPVSVAQAKKSLRIEADSTDMDDLVELWVRGITTKLEHEIGQVVMEQTWVVTADWLFPGIDLPHPVIAVTGITYLDQEGVRQTLDPQLYTLTSTEFSSTLSAADGSCWPDGRGVEIIVSCGFGAEQAAVPANVQLYVLAKLAEQYDPVTKTERGSVQSEFIDGLLDACKTYR
ncbi:MAG: hypothetical protein GAK35_02377 [Herbaspirillum frisingense]|uniref:Phage gp6-like head-tail connector protein n=1 Tax=Herbaspirillum frisingense TaxID=92645 RepID=A0A7V8JTV9_9BURK|nr:MAG: hypothetical protein GAK35_02377 [Herbaspirillum frisingense]